MKYTLSAKTTTVIGEMTFKGAGTYQFNTLSELANQLKRMEKTSYSISDIVITENAKKASADDRSENARQKDLKEEARKLATDITYFSSDVDPYGMTFEEYMDSAIYTYEALRTGDDTAVNAMREFLSDQITYSEEGDHLREQAEDLLSRIQHFFDEYF